ncbi:protein-tyrosine phosphatase-like protein [Hyaloraphidium curvatum]|nr:protein-tyrosine phosphatase-like protein [Hyaloraphidium curvatum]
MAETDKKHRLRRLSTSIVHFLNISRALSHGPPTDPSELPSEILDHFLWVGTGENAANPWILNELLITHIVNVGGLPHGAWESSHVGLVGQGLESAEEPDFEHADLDAALGLKIAKLIVDREAEKLDARDAAPHGANGAHWSSEPPPQRKRRRSSVVVPESFASPPDLAKLRISYLNLVMRDSVDADIASHFREVAAFIDGAARQLRDRARVLLHCQQGVSRSVTLAIAYLMISRGMTLDEAYRLVKERRPQARPNWGFQQQLLDFYMDELGGTDEGCCEFREMVRKATPIQLGWH